MRAIVTQILVCTLSFATPALSQPLPDTISSSTLTRAQESELQRRLTLLGSRLTVLASETQLRETAVRNIAIEIFGARPDLDFNAYASLIDSGARQLRDYISAARLRSESDPTQAALRESAIAAAEEGHLSDARSLYNQLIAANRDARRSARQAEDLADAADIAEAARLAFIVGDLPDAARLFGDAADLAPMGTRVRWLYRVMQSLMITNEGKLRPGDPGVTIEMELANRANPAALAQATRVLRDARADAPADWQWILERLGEESSDIGSEFDLTLAGVYAVQELYAPANASTGQDEP